MIISYGQQFRKNSQTPKKTSFIWFWFNAALHLNYSNICFHPHLAAHWVDLLIIFENSVIFIVLSSSKTLMAPYFRAKFLCLAFKALKKIGPPSRPHICSAQGWISHSAKTVSWLAHKYSTLLDILPPWCLFPYYVNYLFFLSAFQMTGVN